MSVRRGLEAKLYRSTNALTGTTVPTGSAWAEVTSIQNNTLSAERGEADTSTRGGGGIATSSATLSKFTIDFNIPYDHADANLVAFENAYVSNTEVGCAVMSGPIATAGSRGLVSNFEVFKFERAEQLEGVQMASITIKPSSWPQWYVAP